MPSFEHHETVAWPSYTREKSTIALPPAAAAKLRAFEDESFASEAAARAARKRRDEVLRPVIELRRAVAEGSRDSASPHPVNVSELARLEQELEHREETLRRFQSAQREAGGPLARIRQALDTLPAGTVLVAVEAREPKKGATLVTVRETVAGLKRDIAKLEHSAPTVQEQMDALRGAIAEKAKAGRPRMDRSGGLKVSAFTNSGTAALSVLCWYDAEGVLKRLVEDGLLHEAGAVPAAEKTAALETLHANLFEAEVLEEALIQRDGGTRRADADSLAVLGLRVEAGAKRRAA
ncbi:hypothetical protein [Xanthobacter autotrophicus]|uniref:hypothetical protein n=1 Tax=Xanthobacter autotrophicus TaxID=280 RepID=UPI0024A648E1|nr:hypothetical protein [Xanthobacter autotrophicus]MDI4656570.1 hypothetical protein [Xanthobacter autotrophicus]